MSKQLTLALFLALTCLASAAPAHYLWVALDAKATDQTVANLFFEEAPAAGDGGYLDPFVSAGQTWIRTAENPQPRLLEMREATAPGKRWLTTELPHPAPRSIDSYGKFGVYRYGATDVLLHYYARYLDVATHEDLHELGRAEQLRLDIVPHDHAEEVELTILWNGKPAPGRPVFIRGPRGFRKNATADDAGTVDFSPEAPGRYLFRTNVEEEQAGEDQGKSYALVRHHATLVLNLPLQK